MKKNKIFINKIERRIDNNQKSVNVIENMESYEQQKNDITINGNNLTVNEKIDALLNRNGYVFNLNVKIITDKKDYLTRIAGKVNNKLITLDNDSIYISDIKDIIILE